MSVANVYICHKVGSSTTSRSESSRQAPLSAVTLLPDLRSPRFLRSLSPTCSTHRRKFFHRQRVPTSGVLHVHGRERAQGALVSRPLSALHCPGLRKNVSCGSSTKRSRIRSAAGETAGGVDGESTSNCLYLKRTIYNGEVLKNPGTVVILGDVEPGGQVLADGDVVVLGRLQGKVQAGRGGDVTSKIFATSIEAKEIRIGDNLFSCPDNEQIHVSTIAALSADGSIKIFPAVEEAVEKQSVTLSRGMSPSILISQAEGRRNRRPAAVALVTGIYISVAGIALLVFPRVFFGILFDLEGVKLGWVRIGAILAVVFGVYYIGTAVGDMRGMNGAEAFYLSTVVGRTFLFLSFSWLVLTGAVPTPLLLVGAVNLVGAISMLKALKAPGQSSA